MWHRPPRGRQTARHNSNSMGLPLPLRKPHLWYTTQNHSVSRITVLHVHYHKLRQWRLDPRKSEMVALAHHTNRSHHQGKLKLLEHKVFLNPENQSKLDKS